MIQILAWISGAWDFITSAGGTWPYLPHWMRWVWQALVVVFAFTLLASFLFKHLSPERASIEARLHRQERARQLATRDGFGVQYETPSETMLFRTPPSESGFMGSVLERKLLIEDREVTFQIIVVYDRASWKLQSPTLFENENGSAINLRNLLSDQAYRQRIGATRDIVCVGLASRAPNEEASEANEDLSRQRSENLCSHVATNTDPLSHRFWAVALGGSVATANTEIESRRQRSAVIVGVNGGPDLDLQESVRSVLMSTQLSNVDLSAYSRSSNPMLRQIDSSTRGEPSPPQTGERAG